MNYWIFLLQIFIALIITIVIHEAGHLVASLLCGVKVNAFSIGFGKPALRRKWKGIIWQITPWLIGGYTAIEGENSKVPNGFLVQSYIKKMIIVLSGVAVNFLLVLICHYLIFNKITYSSLKGVLSMWQPIMYSTSTGIVFFLLRLELYNLVIGIINLIPIPPLDGSYVWMLGLEKIMSEEAYKITSAILKAVGLIIVTLLQLAFVYYIWNI